MQARVSRRKNFTSFGVEVLTERITKSGIFWNVMPYSLAKVHQYFGETCCFYIRGGSESQASKAAISQQQSDLTDVSEELNTYIYKVDA
jgi:hypothetical protein